jgi:hypothetical protein
MKTFDMRQFFGGMAAYHDSQRMATVLGVKTDFKFVNDFADGKNGQVNNVLWCVVAVNKFDAGPKLLF